MLTVNDIHSCPLSIVHEWGAAVSSPPPPHTLPLPSEQVQEGRGIEVKQQIV